MKYKQFTLKDLATIKYGKSQKKVQSESGTIPIYGTGGLMGYATEALYNKPSVLIGRKGTIKKVRFVEQPFWTVDTLFYTEVRENVVVPKYLYYLMSLIDLESYNEGTTIPSLRKETLYRLEFEVPDLEYQQKVITMLDPIDQKIRRNKEINENLEQQAQAIYVSMFVTHADPSWKTGHLSDIVVVKYGKDHKKLANGQIPVYGSGGIMRYAEHSLYDKESVLIPRKGTLNNVIYVNQPFWTVDTMFYTEMRLPNVAKFVYHFVKSKDLASMNAGSAVPSMTKAILNALEVVIPSDDALEKFEKILAPMYEEIQKNNNQSSTLGKFRDTLLPKLMSGEIDVSSIQL